MHVLYKSSTYFIVQASDTQIYLKDLTCTIVHLSILNYRYDSNFVLYGDIQSLDQAHDTKALLT